MGLLDAAASIVTGGGKSPLKKLQILIEGDSSDITSPFQNPETVDVLFNPQSIVFSHKTEWQKPIKTPTVSPPKTPAASKDAPASPPQPVFAGWPPVTLTLELFFDSTEAAPNVSANSDVRISSSKIMKLTEMKPNKHRPPLCMIKWGDGYPVGTPLLIGFASTITQTFSYFDPTGKPLRVKLACLFTQWTDQKEMHSTDVHKSHIIKRGDTLASIAQEKLHDAKLWRPIAVANGLTDPLDLEPGRTLWIPTVRER
jgi:nucleoid-associated protein YgaU